MGFFDFPLESSANGFVMLLLLLLLLNHQEEPLNNQQQLWNKQYKKNGSLGFLLLLSLARSCRVNMCLCEITLLLSKPNDELLNSRHVTCT
jgi:hypothetical protein